MRIVTSDRCDNRRQFLLAALRRFIVAVQHITGVRSIALLGSVMTAKPNPKDIDVLIVVDDDADLAALATASRRLQGDAQSRNCGADVFLANPYGAYIGRMCHWRDCRPGVRLACDARHCGQRPYLHDDLDMVHLAESLVTSPPLTVWPDIKRRVPPPPDVEEFIATLHHAV